MLTREWNENFVILHIQQYKIPPPNVPPTKRRLRGRQHTLSYNKKKTFGQPRTIWAHVHIGNKSWCGQFLVLSFFFLSFLSLCAKMCKCHQYPNFQMEMLLGTPRNVTPGVEFGRINWYGIWTTPVRFFNLGSSFRVWINSSTSLTFSENRLNAALACKRKKKTKSKTMNDNSSMNPSSPEILN